MDAALTTIIVGFLLRVVGAAVLVFCGTLLSRWAARLVDKATARAGLEETLRRFVIALTRWLVLVIVVVMSLGIFGVQTTSVAALLGAAGIAVALALQGTLSSFAAGVMLLVFRPFKVGDSVDIGGRRGKVSAIDLLFTSVDTPDNRRLILPNGQVFGAAIENLTFHPTRRADVLIGAAYGADLDETRRILEQVVASVTGRVPEAASQVVLAGLGASSVDWELRVWCQTPDHLGMCQRLRHDAKLAFDAAGIGIPFPQLDVHLAGTPALRSAGGQPTG